MIEFYSTIDLTEVSIRIEILNTERTFNEVTTNRIRINFMYKFYRLLKRTKLEVMNY